MTCIIGSGYLGLRFKKFFTPSVSTNLPELIEIDQVPFDFSETDFKKLPAADTLIITCSIEHLGERAKDFAQFSRHQYKHIILISSASLFHVTQANQSITEETPLIVSPRVDAESCFFDFAFILNCGLLWDKQERQPKRWLEQGSIKNGNKLINFTNADNLGSICESIIASSPPYGRYICTDAPAQSWQEVANKHEISLPSKPVDLRSKSLSNRKLQTHLGKKIFLPHS